jgi:FlaA1/EpsC-like NDP-sugar epimerase
LQRFTNYLSAVPRSVKVSLQVAVDATLVAVSFFSAMAIRLDNLQFVSSPKLWTILAFLLPITIAIYWALGLYRSLVRYITGSILRIVGLGALLSALALYAVGVIWAAGVPRSVPVIYAIVVFLAVGGLRFIARALFRQPTVNSRKPVIIYGAGDAGLQLLNALYHGRDYDPVALVDDDPRLQKLSIGGRRVFSPDQISQISGQTGARIILLAMPSLSRARRREIVNSLRHLRLEIKTVPGMSEIIDGKAQISELRTVEPEDLLGRDPVAPDQDLLRRNVSGKVVMVSGAGGSIGSELSRQILSLEPAALILYEISEYALYAIETELAEAASRMQRKVRVVPILGSVQDARRLEATIRTFKVQTIYHAAAYKHVPLVEDNVIEGIRNNVLGTLSISSVARRCDVESFILISTDKAVRPTNIMGSTKRIAELICQAHAEEKPTTVYSMVRFGNVLGSSGSVIPRFKAQIQRGGPVTVTHREINRFFMTIPEASQLVIQAGAMAKGGDVFVLDMGQPVKIMDLAKDMIALHGLVPYEVERPDEVFPERGDIAVCVTGLRKGEKLYEELLIGNNPEPTSHPRIMTSSEAFLSSDKLMSCLEQLRVACDAHDVPRILEIIRALPVDYTPDSSQTLDLIWTATQELERERASDAGSGTVQ